MSLSLQPLLGLSGQNTHHVQLLVTEVSRAGLERVITVTKEPVQGRVWRPRLVTGKSVQV